MQRVIARSSVRARVLVAFGVVGSLLLSSMVTSTVGVASPLQQAEPTPAPPSTTPPAPAPDPHARGGALKAEYDEVLGREAELLSRLETARSDLWNTTVRLNELQAELEEANIKLMAAQVALEDAIDKAAIAAAVADDAEQRESRATERLRRQIVSAYVTGGEDKSALEALLSASSTDDAAKAMTYSRAVVGDTDALVQDLGRAREIRQAADKAAEAARAEAQTARDEISNHAAFIRQGYIDQQVLADEVTMLVAVETQALQEVQGRRFIIESRINSMNRASDGVGMILAAAQQGQPDWRPDLYEVTTPLPGRRIGSKFGQRLHPILGITRLHAGGDFGAPSGTPIHAVADGRVLIAEVRGGYGNTVVIDHGSSLGTVSAHMSRMDVAVGSEVKRGDQIGLVGSTGLSTGPHLHFETRIKGLPIDPEGVIDWDAEIDYPR